MTLKMGLSKLLFNVVLFSVVLFVLSEISTADDWKDEIKMSVFKIIRISKYPDFEIRENTKQEKTRVLCSITCFQSASFYYHENNSTCICNSGADSEAEENEDVIGELIYGIKTTTIITSSLQTLDKQFKRVHKQPEARDCLVLFQHGYTEDGVYVIKPWGTDTDNFCSATVDGCDLIGTNIDVWCDMSNGGWTVIQRRQDGSVDFYKDWYEYKIGFGNVIDEYWIGLENIHILTSSSSSLHVEMKTFGDVSPRSAHAEYSSFRITDENDQYRLIIGGYHGSCSDALLYHHNGSQFTTRDQDNDLNDDGNCAISSTGAWWYNKCLASNLNGRYLKGADSAYAQGIVWVHCWTHTYSLKETVMKIRRNE